MKTTYGNIGPATALQLLLLWLEGKHSATLPEIERWETIVLASISRVEARMDHVFGAPDGDSSQLEFPPSAD